MANNGGQSQFFASSKPNQSQDRVTLYDAAGNPVTVGGGGTSDPDGTPFVPGVTEGTPAMGQYSAVPRVVADGDLGIISIDQNGNVITTGGGTQYARGTAVAGGQKTTLAGVYRADTPVAQDANGLISVLLVDATGRVWVATNTPTGLLNGSTTVTTAGTRVALAASTTVRGVLVMAQATNTGLIYVGGGTVDNTNVLGLKKRERIYLAITNLATVFLDSSVDGEGVTYLAVTGP